MYVAVRRRVVPQQLREQLVAPEAPQRARGVDYLLGEPRQSLARRAERREVARFGEGVLDGVAGGAAERVWSVCWTVCEEGGGWG